MKKISLLFIIAVVYSSCSPKRSSGERTRLGIRMPEVSSLQSITPAVSADSPYVNSGIWGLKTPTAMSELNCFGIAVTFPEETKNSCHLLSGELIDLDEMFGSVKEGSLLEADITSGESRNIQVFGFATSDGSCPEDMATLSKEQMAQSSPPVILGETLIDVEGESMEVEVVISMSNPIVVNDCSGDWYTWEEGALRSDQFNLDNGYLTLSGANLGSAHTAKIVDADGVVTELFIESKNNNALAMKALSALDLASSAVYELFISNAYGQEIYSITVGGAATSGTLSSMGAVSGQILKFDGTNWVPSDLSAMTYAGIWDASICSVPNPSAVGGEYYIVSQGGPCDPGDGNSRTWAIGDWVIFNDSTSNWDQVSAGTQVTSFNGRTGAVTPSAADYNWSMLDFTGSTLNSIADVSTISPTAGQVLKFDGISWVADNDLDSGATAGSITGASIADGAITDADISASAAIAQSKVDGLAILATDVANNTTSISNMSSTLSLKLDMNAIDIDSTLSAMSDSSVPSQNAVKTYVDTAISGAGTVTSIIGGSGLTDGPITSMGTLDVNVDNLTLEVVSDALQLKDGGVTSSKIADNSIQDIDIMNISDTKISSSCTDGQMIKSSVGSIGCSTVYEMSGFVGIGTTTPTEMLDISGNINSMGIIRGNSFQGQAGSTSSSPLYSFSASPSTGFFSDTTDVISVSLAGTNIFNFDTGRLISPASAGAAIRSNSGSVTSPVYSFATFEDTGMYVKSVNGMLSFTAEGVDRMVIDPSNGFVGVGTNTPAYALDVIGVVAGTGAYMNSSDIRYKRDLELVSYDGESALEKIAKLNGYYYYWRLDEFPNKKFSEGRDLGVVAQEVEEVFPEAVVEDNKGYKSVAYSKLISPLIEAVKELFVKSESDKKELRRELASVKAENKVMKEYLCEKDSSAPFCD